MFVTSIDEEKISAKVRLIHAEQMFLRNFIILRKRRDSNTGVFLWNLWNFQGQWWLLLKAPNILSCNKKICRAKINHLQRRSSTPFKHDVAWLWEEQADSRNVCRNKKKYCSYCITLIRIDTILSKNIYNNFQNLLFRKLLAQSGDHTDIFWKFYSPADILWLPKNVGRVSGYTTEWKERKELFFLQTHHERWQCFLHRYIYTITTIKIFTCSYI